MKFLINKIISWFKKETCDHRYIAIDNGSQYYRLYQCRKCNAIKSHFEIPWEYKPELNTNQNAKQEFVKHERIYT